MTADKLKLDGNIEHHQCGDNTKVRLSHNLETSQGSSSDESTKSKSENDNPADKSSDSSIKDDSDGIRRDLNTTYLCCKSESVDDSGGDAKLQTTYDFSPKLENDGNNWLLNTTARYRNLFSMSTNFDAFQWNSEITDLKLENLDDLGSIDENTDTDCLLLRIRNFVADYQEQRGTPRDEYTFSNLIRFMGQATGRCLSALFYVLINIAPVAEIFIHILRFILDKLIDLKSTVDSQQIILKTSVFFGQLMCIYVCLVFIFSFMVFPVIRMAIGILAKVMLYD